MKAKYLREMPQANPAYSRDAEQAAMRAGKLYREPRYVQMPAGTVVEHKDAWKLVTMGVAEPADDECREYAEASFARNGKTLAAGMKDAAQAQELLAKGIHPTHYKAFREGRMDGYDADGNTTLRGDVVELPEDQRQGETMVVVIEKDKE